MIAAIQAEYRKLFSTKLWWILLLAMVLYIGAIAFGMGWYLASMATHPSGGAAGETLDELRGMVYDLAPSSGFVFPTIVGMVSVTSEYRHHTIVPTYLGQPRRIVVAAAKLCAAIPMGVVIGIAGTLAAVGLGAAGLSMKGVPAQLGSAVVWGHIGLSILVMMLWTLLGVGLGMLVTNQVAAIVGLLIFTQLVEPLLVLLGAAKESLANFTKFLPASASSSASGGSSIYSMGSAEGPQAHVLSQWQGLLVLLAYALVFAAAGFLFRRKQDIA